MTLRAAVTLCMTFVTLDLSVAEFVEIQRMTPPQLRLRFGLPESCEPRLAALRTSGADVNVLIRCEEAAATPASVSAPTAQQPAQSGPLSR